MKRHTDSVLKGIETERERTDYSTRDGTLWLLFLVSACLVVWTASSLVQFRENPGEWYIRSLGRDASNDTFVVLS